MWIVFTDNGKPYAVTSPRIYSMAGQISGSKKKQARKCQHPYRMYHKPYNEQRQQGERWNRPQLKNKLKPAQELEVQQIMENFNCQYDDVVEAVDLYNLDIEECVTA